MCDIMPAFTSFRQGLTQGLPSFLQLCYQWRGCLCANGASAFKLDVLPPQVFEASDDEEESTNGTNADPAGATDSTRILLMGILPGGSAISSPSSLALDSPVSKRTSTYSGAYTTSLLSYAPQLRESQTQFRLVLSIIPPYLLLVPARPVSPSTRVSHFVALPILRSQRSSTGFLTIWTLCLLDLPAMLMCSTQTLALMLRRLLKLSIDLMFTQRPGTVFT
ncbi:hypothetical protein BGW80DRAFT_910130 [Lactifluus volemus]|nr:hypothetical protein BGW80DRAFT_910130 [Lactifluus volemus]